MKKLGNLIHFNDFYKSKHGGELGNQKLHPDIEPCPGISQSAKIFSGFF